MPIDNLVKECFRLSSQFIIHHSSSQIKHNVTYPSPNPCIILRSGYISPCIYILYIYIYIICSIDRRLTTVPKSTRYIIIATEFISYIVPSQVKSSPSNIVSLPMPLHFSFSFIHHPLLSRTDILNN
jgi:hypothetical protein